MILLLSGPDLKTYVSNFKKLLPQKLRCLYVPSWYGSKSTKDFKAFKKAVSVLKWDVEYFPVDRKLSDYDLALYENADCIILDGGNTFFLMKHLRKSGLGRLIKNRPRNHTIGLSAGALVLTPSIRLAKYPDYTADDNFVGLKDLSGLGLVDFEVSVHCDGTKEEMFQIQKCAIRVPDRTIYNLRDREFIRIEGKKKTFFRRLQLIKLKNP